MIEWETKPGPQAMQQTFDILERNLQNLQYEVEHAAQVETAFLTNEIAIAMARNFATHNRTGASIRSIRTRIVGLMGIITMKGGAVYIEFGTAAHGPKTARVMRFISGGLLFFRRWVRGVERHPFVEDAFAEVEAINSYERIGQSVIQGLSKGLGRFK